MGGDDIPEMNDNSLDHEDLYETLVLAKSKEFFMQGFKRKIMSRRYIMPLEYRKLVFPSAELCEFKVELTDFESNPLTATGDML